MISFTLYRYQNIPRFFIARFARLYPIYWAAIIFSIILHLLLSQKMNVSDYLLGVTMLQGYFNRSVISGSFWTLTYELTFYILIAFMFKLKLFNRSVVLLVLVMISGVWLYFNFIGLISDDAVGFWHNASNLLLEFLPLFMFGIFLYKCYREGWKLVYVLFLVFLVILDLAFFPPLDDASYHVNISRIWMMIIFSLCICATYFPSQAILSNKILTFCGKISYSWYLTHLMFFHFMYDLLLTHLGFYPTAILSFLLSLGIATLFNQWIEDPCHNYLLQRFVSKKSG